jgi:general transcription factor 3C polypeptide 5 (transcription factor C subunit 1)
MRSEIVFLLKVSDTLGEGLSTGYLEEVLRSFPLNEHGQDKLGGTLNNAEASDGEFEIFEQPSDDEDSDG